MPRSNPSHVSYSSAASASFRLRTLRRAEIGFGTLESECPEEISTFRAQLAHWPDAFHSMTKFEEMSDGAQTLTPQYRDEVAKAVNMAQCIADHTISNCTLQHERVWMRSVNEPALQDLINETGLGRLSSTEDYLWTEGRHLMGFNAESLHDPKPDFAFGLHAETNSGGRSPKAWEPLSERVLDLLHQSSSCSLTFSPSQMQDIVYPALIFEAKSDKNSIVWAENQVAVGATRALALLSELLDLAELPALPYILAVTSAGPQWQFHLAYKTLDTRVVSHQTVRSCGV